MQKAPPYVTILIAGAIFLTLGYWLGGASKTETEHVDLGSQAKHILDPEGAEREERARKNAAKDEAEKRVLAQRKKQDAVDLAKRGTDLYDEALAEEARWKNEVETLLTNDEGRFIVSDEALKDFEKAYKKERAPRDALLSGKAAIESLIAPVKPTLDDPQVDPPSSELEARIRVEKEKAGTELEKYRNGRLAIEAVVAGKNAGQRGDVTLADALDTLHRNEVAATNAAARKLEDELNAKKKADAEARQRFLAQARDPALLAKFQPFLADGKYTGGQIISLSGILEGTSAAWADGEYPTSYSELQTPYHNALTDFNAFLDIACGRNQYRLNDRPKWVCSKANMQEYRNRWEDFKYYAATWRELRLLSK